jgi:hypothetical protein
LAGVASAAEPFNRSPQVDDPIHTPAELVESMHSAFGYNHCRAVNAKGVIFEGEFTPDTHAKEITKAPRFLQREHFAVSRNPKLVGQWQHGIETISGHVQWKLHLTLAHLPSAAFATINHCQQP